MAIAVKNQHIFISLYQHFILQSFNSLRTMQGQRKGTFYKAIEKYFYGKILHNVQIYIIDRNFKSLVHLNIERKLSLHFFRDKI